MTWRKGNLWPSLAIAVILAVTAFQLRQQGRAFWCSCAQPRVWSGDTHSLHNSQHLFDPYGLTHMLHGLVIGGFVAWAAPKLPRIWQLGLTLSVEGLWELFENTAFVIQRYRTATASLGYEGDAIANSLGDLLSCAIGAVVAWRIGLKRSIGVFTLTELLLLLWIRDGLLLNILMLIHPMEAVKNWQMGS